MTFFLRRSQDTKVCSSGVDTQPASRLARGVRFVALLATLMVLGAAPVRAQVDSGLPPSPAYATAQRIQGEAQALWAQAYQLHAAGKYQDAGVAHSLAQLRAHQAINEYGLVTQSHAYGHTAIAAESLLMSARIYRDILTNLDTSAQLYKQLHDNYDQINYPDKAVADQERVALASWVDHRNSTTFPTLISYHIMDFLVKLTGATSQSYWIAIILISVIVKLVMWPISNAQYKSMKEMQKLQPYIAEIKGKYKDPQVQGEKIRELYQEHNVNMFGGCLPLLVQLPIWYLLFNMIRAYQFQFQHGSFLWIGSSLSHVYPNIFATDLNQPDIPLLGLYMLSMYISQKLTVPADPQAAEQARMMAVMTPFLSGYFFLQYKWPSAFLLYYLVFNILSMVQQRMYQRGNAAADTDTGKTTQPTPARNGRSADDISTDLSPQINGARPTAKGAIAPKVHPKKKRR